MHVKVKCKQASCVPFWPGIVQFGSEGLMFFVLVVILNKLTILLDYIRQIKSRNMNYDEDGCSEFKSENVGLD